MALLPTYLHPTSGSDGLTFYNLLQAWMVGQDDPSTGNLQVIENRLEALVTALFGSGVLAGTPASPLITAGTGLSANIGAFKALIGIVVDKSAGGWNVGGLTPSTTNYLWIKQDGTYTATTTSTNPGTTNNPAILLGTATTSASAVTAVADTYVLIYLPLGGLRRERFTTKTGGAAFDAAADRTGAACTITLSATPATGSLTQVFLERECFVETDDYTQSGAVITFVDGAKPQAGELVRVLYFA